MCVCLCDGICQNVHLSFFIKLYHYINFGKDRTFHFNSVGAFA